MQQEFIQQCTGYILLFYFLSHPVASSWVLYLFWRRFSGPHQAFFSTWPPTTAVAQLPRQLYGVSGTSIQHRWNCEVTCRHTLPLTLQVQTQSRLSWLIFCPVFLHGPQSPNCYCWKQHKRCLCLTIDNNTGHGCVFDTFFLCARCFKCWWQLCEVAVVDVSLPSTWLAGRRRG